MIAYRVLFAALLGLAALVLAGCDGQKGTPAGKGAGKDAGKVYDIKEKVLSGLKAGDAVHGKLRADGGNYVVTSLEKH
jgi:hypothetical protein